ncbi:MAG: HpsJ family protein [Potamolinea sp.]
MRSPKNTPWSLAVVRKVGYGLLMLALFDLVAIFVPLRLTNPVWQFETMGAIVERVAVPLIGLVLISFGETEFRSDFEQKVLKFLSWLCLIVGVLFILLLPLGLINTWQVKMISNNQINNQFLQQKSQMERAEKKLNQMKDEELANYIKSQGRTLDNQTPEQAKEQFLAKLNKDKQQMQTRLEEVKTNRRLVLIKNSVKWNLGALVAGVLFIYIWNRMRGVF